MYCRGEQVQDIGFVQEQLEGESLSLFGAIVRSLDTGIVDKTLNGLPVDSLLDRHYDGDLGRVRTGRVIDILVSMGSPLARVIDKFSRGGCGQDLRLVIEKIPQDGETYFFDCPACEMKHHVTRN